MPTPTYDLISSTTLASATSTITFSSIPSTYRDLILVANASAPTDDIALITFNGDGGSNYSTVVMYGAGPGSESLTGTSIRTFRIGSSNSGSGIIQIMDYSATDKHKTLLYRIGEPSRMVSAGAGRWANTAAITSFSWSPIAGNWASGSTFSIYGVIS
jgi:hypothetical protein